MTILVIIGPKVFHPEVSHSLETVSSQTNELSHNKGGPISSASDIELPFNSVVEEERGKDTATADSDDAQDGEGELAKEFGARDAEEEVNETEACAVENVPPPPLRKDHHKCPVIFSKTIGEALTQCHSLSFTWITIGYVMIFIKRVKD